MWRNPAQIEVIDSATSDLTLVHASKEGDVAAFGELVKRYDRKLFRIAHHLTRSAEDAEDVVQDAFLNAFQHLPQFREDSKFSTWLIRIVLNLALMKLRKRRPTKEFSLDSNSNPEDDHLAIDVADWAPNPEQLYKAAELREILRRALEKLSPGLRMAFVLRDIEGLSLEQTAEALGLSVAAVKARTWRARLQLRQRLSRHFHKPPAVEPRSAPVAVSSLPTGT